MPVIKKYVIIEKWFFGEILTDKNVSLYSKYEDLPLNVYFFFMK